MLNKTSIPPLIFNVMAIVAILFGLLTIKSGGMVLFTDGDAHQAAGNYIPFVLWFNFIAGFFYIATGIGLWLKKPWASKLAVLIAIFTVAVFALFVSFIAFGSDYELRTVGAMTFRSVVWMGIASIAYNKLTTHGARYDCN